MAEVFSLSGSVVLDDRSHVTKKLDEIDRKGEKAGKALDKLGKESRTAADQMRKHLAPAAKTAAVAIGVATAAAATAVAMYGVHAVRSFGDFEAAMANVGAVSQATEEELERLTAVAQRMGSVTKFTAEQAAAGLEFLALAGFSVEESIRALPGVLNLAAAANLGLGEAADIASNILSGMRLDVDELERVVDVLAETASNSNTSVRQLGHAMSFAAPLAAEAGVSIEEVSAAIGFLGDAGIQGERAGTSIRNILAQLISPASTASEKLREVGVETMNAAGELLSLTEILRNAAEAGFTGANAMEAFGLRAGPAFSILMATGSDALADFTGRIEDAQGAAQEMAEAQLDNLLGSVELLSGAFDAVTQNVGERLAPTIREFVNWLTANMPTVQRVFESVFGVVNSLLDSFLSGVQTVFRMFQTEVERHLDDVRQLDEEAAALEDLADRYEKLASKSQRTTEEQDELEQVVDALAKSFPALEDELRNTDTAFSDGLPTIREYIASLRALSTARIESLARQAQVELPVLQREQEQLLANRDALEANQTAAINAAQAVERIRTEFEAGAIDAKEATEQIAALGAQFVGINAETLLAADRTGRYNLETRGAVGMTNLFDASLGSATEKVRQQSAAFSDNEDQLEANSQAQERFHSAIEIATQLQNENITVQEAIKRLLGESADAAQDVGQAQTDAAEDAVVAGETQKQTAREVTEEQRRQIMARNAALDEAEGKRLERRRMEAADREARDADQEQAFDDLLGSQRESERLHQTAIDAARDEALAKQRERYRLEAEARKSRDAEVERLQEEHLRRMAEQRRKDARLDEAAQNAALDFQAETQAELTRLQTEERERRNAEELATQEALLAEEAEKERMRRMARAAALDEAAAKQAERRRLETEAREAADRRALETFEENLRSRDDAEAKSFADSIKRVNVWKDDFINAMDFTRAVVDGLSGSLETMFEEISEGTNVFKAAGEGLKGFVIAIISAIQKQLIATQVSQIATASAMSFLTLGASLLAIPGIIAAIGPALLVLEGLKAAVRGIKLERGGTLSDDALALVGERGPELAFVPGGTTVVPLDDRRVDEAAMRAFAAGLIVPQTMPRPTVEGPLRGATHANLFIDLDGERIAEAVGVRLVDTIRLQTGIRDA